jgi:hypothetical protein
MYVVLHPMMRQRGYTNGVAMRCVQARPSHLWHSSRDSSADNFASIVAAVEEGRGIYDNIAKTLAYLLGGNAEELTVMCIAAAARRKRSSFLFLAGAILMYLGLVELVKPRLMSRMLA